MRGRLLLLLGVLLLLPTAAGARATQTADMSLTGTVTPERLFVNQRATFTVTATNNGPDRANIVRISGTPSKGTAVSTTITRTDSSCAIRPKTSTCLAPFLERGETFTMTMQVTATGAGEVTLEASVVAVETDPDATNQQATISATVLPPDSLPPTALGVGRLVPFQTVQPFEVSWKGKDALTGIASYSVRYRSAPLNGAFGPVVAWRQGAEKTAQFKGQPGRTYCFSATATDNAGNTAAYSAESCTAIPLPASAARRSGPWRQVKAADSLGGQYLVSSQPGATLRLRNVQAKRLVLWFSRCPTCGEFLISFAGRSLGSLNLRSSTLRRGAAKTLLDSTAIRTGDLVLTVKPPEPPKTKAPRKPKKGEPPAPPPPPPPPAPIQIEAFGIGR